MAWWRPAFCCGVPLLELLGSSYPQEDGPFLCLPVPFPPPCTQFCTAGPCLWAVMTVDWSLGPMVLGDFYFWAWEPLGGACPAATWCLYPTCLEPCHPTPCRPPCLPPATIAAACPRIRSYRL